MTTLLPKVILVRPRIMANVGFVARTLANFGIEDWTLVDCPAWEGTEAARTGAPALETLRRATIASSLAEALADSTLAIGLTARTGKHRRTLAPKELGPLIVSAGPHPESRTALIFGPEDRGLEREESELCTTLITIPTRGLASLNLSHAVAIVLYEWFRDESIAAPTESEKSIRYASQAEKERLALGTQQALEATGFRFPHPHYEGAIRRLTRLPIEARDLRILEKVVRHAEWKREEEGRSE